MGKITIPRNSYAKFACKAQGHEGTVTLLLRAEEADEDELKRIGHAKASRKFKRNHDLHPCCKVDTKFLGIFTNAQAN